MLKTLFPEMRLCIVNLSEGFPSGAHEMDGKATNQIYFHSFKENGHPAGYHVGRSELLQSIGGMQTRSHNSGRDEVITMEQIRWHNKRKEEAKQKKQNILVWISAVSILFIFALSTVLYQTNRNEISGLYQEYFSPSGTFPKPHIKGGPDNGIWNSSLEAFREGNYALANTILQKISPSSPLFVHAGFASGLCLMSDNNYMGALAKFGDINGRSEYYPKAQWFSALCYLKTGEINSARLLFEQIAGSQSGFKKKAREILQKLNGVL